MEEDLWDCYDKVGLLSLCLSLSLVALPSLVSPLPLQPSHPASIYTFSKYEKGV